MSAGDLRSVVGQLRDLASKAASNGKVTQSAPHPDAELLELCAKALDFRAEYEAIWREARKLQPSNMTNPAYEAEIKKAQQIDKAGRSPMMRISRIPAKTAAGVYAKAQVLLATYAAPKLGASLASDLVTLPGLRSVLWPAGEAAGEQ
jgi:hypothetical protein